MNEWPLVPLQGVWLWEVPMHAFLVRWETAPDGDVVAVSTFDGTVSHKEDFDPGKERFTPTLSAPGAR